MMDEEFHELDNVFDTFRDGSGSLPAPLGPAAARATVRRRRQLRAGVTGGLAALLIAAPVAAYAVGAIGTNGPPVGGETTPSPSPSVSASPSPSPTPSASPKHSEEVAAPPDGRIDQATLKESTLTLPAWPYLSKNTCPAGTYTFSGGELHLPRSGSQLMDSWLQVQQSVYVDIDSDGAEETAVVVTCTGIETGEHQVVVLDRDTDGKIVTLGTALFTSANQQDTSGLPLAVRGMEARGNELALEVGDKRACCGQNPALAMWQWRTFGYDGSGFVQTGGPTEFEPNPLVTDLRVVSATLEGATTGDTFTGTLKITVRNAGPFKVNSFVAFSLPRPATLKTVPMGCQRDDNAILGPDTDNRDFSYFCAMGPTAPGGDITLETFQVTGPAADFAVGDTKVFAAAIWGAIDPDTFPEGWDQLPDLNRDDNEVEKTFTVK